MKLLAKITSLDNCKLSIQDISTYKPEYENYTGDWNQQLKKSHTASVILAVVEDGLKSTITVKAVSFTPSIAINFDGNFKLYYVVLPTKECIFNNSELLKNYDSEFIYYIEDNQIKKLNSGTSRSSIVVDLSELVEIINQPNIRSTASYISREQVSICSLQKCYVNLCQQIFESKAFSSCFNKNNIDNELIYKRDLVWMAINVIDYLSKCGQFEEANRYIKLLNSNCGVCGDNKTGGNHNGCGCS